MQTPDSPRPKIRILNIALAVFAIAAGGVLAYAGWTLRSASALEGEAADARTAAGGALAALIETEAARLDAQRVLPRVREAIAGNNIDGARAALAGDWVGIEAVEIHPSDLQVQWSSAERFGYGKLGVMVAALDKDGVQLAVVQDAGRAWLSLAAPIENEGAVLAVAYVRRPLDLFTAPITAAPAPSPKITQVPRSV
jgi:phosphomannomutase/phosphoglucomutase